jgi:hypothetical protein
VIMRTIDASDRVRTLVDGVFSPCGTAVIARWQQVWTWVRRVIWTYLDGGNGVGKIPP